MTRIESESATVVAITSSEQIEIAIVVGGTRRPPTPTPAIVPSATVVFGFVGFATASAPVNAAMQRSADGYETGM
jgi:hypothetical protein